MVCLAHKVEKKNAGLDAEMNDRRLEVGLFGAGLATPLQMRHEAQGVPLGATTCLHWRAL